MPGKHALGNPKAFGIALLVLLCWCGKVCGQAPSKAPETSSQAPLGTSVPVSLEQAWETLDRLPALRGSSRSLALRSPQGALLRSYDGERLLVPASTAKLLATAAILDQLGTDYRFQTTLLKTGHWYSKGVWEGDIVLLGGGDPSLGSGRGQCPDRQSLLQEWVAAIRDAGIRSIRGRIVGDGLAWGLPETPGSWAWDDLGNHFAPAMDALTFSENRFQSHFRTPIAPGALATLTATEPALPYFDIQHRVRSGRPGSGDQAYAFSAPEARRIEWQGTLPPGRKRYAVKGAWPDPSLAAAAQLEMALVAAGIAVEGGAVSAWSIADRNALFPASLPQQGIADRRKATDLGDTLWTGQSPPLRTLVQWTNRESLNGYAEAMARALGALYGDPSVDGGVQALQDWLSMEAQAACSPSDRCHFDAWKITDGSGLSRRNQVDALTFSALLHHWTKALWFDAFLASLPRSGSIGTLARVAPQAPGRLAAKSGTIGGVRAYAGYWQGRSGAWYPLVVLLNHADASGSAMRLALDPVLQSLVDLP